MPVPLFKVNNGDKFKVKWIDGSSYVGKVLSKETAVACVRPDGYPKEYRIWITANDLVGDYQLNGQACSDDSSKGIYALFYIYMMDEFQSDQSNSHLFCG